MSSPKISRVTAQAVWSSAILRLRAFSSSGSSGSRASSLRFTARYDVLRRLDLLLVGLCFLVEHQTLKRLREMEPDRLLRREFRRRLTREGDDFLRAAALLQAIDLRLDLRETQLALVLPHTQQLVRRHRKVVGNGGQQLDVGIGVLRFPT